MHDDLDRAFERLASVLPGYTPRKPQLEVSHAVLEGMMTDQHVVVEAGTGTGKCFSPGTPILMFDGSVLPAEQVRVGDRVMGPDSRPRTVLSVCSGEDEMYQVTPVKGDPYTVNSEHILSLKMTNKGSKGARRRADGSIVNISVRDYLTRGVTFKHCAKGYRVGVDFTKRPVPVDPYLLGVWLGDGSSRTPDMTSADTEVVEAIALIATEMGLVFNARCQKGAARRYSLTDPLAHAHQPNRFTSTLRSLGVFGNKHIPAIYKANSRCIRLQLLAGLIDTDGSLTCNTYDLVFKQEELARDAAYIARSLGLAVTIRQVEKTCCNNGVSAHYWRLNISGDIAQIPVRVTRKKASPRLQKKDALLTGIRVEPVGRGPYCGFTVDGDHLFLLGDFTVTHNSLAYLLPAALMIRHGRVVVISTHTIGLQSQLFKKDIPILERVFPYIPLDPIIMKGRSNFLCLQDLDAESGSLISEQDAQLQEIRQWAHTTLSGDVADLPFSYPDWNEIACKSDTCRKKDCHYYERCFYYRMKNRAQQCNLIVVNHALLLADLQLKADVYEEEEEDGQERSTGKRIIPKYQHVIFDEAHHLEDVATGAFGTQLEQNRVENMIRRIHKLHRRSDEMNDSLETLKVVNKHFFSLFFPVSEDGKRRAVDFSESVRFDNTDEIDEAATMLTTTLGLVHDRLTMHDADEKQQPIVEGAEKTIERTMNDIESLLISRGPESIRWAELAGSEKKPHVNLRLAPLNPGEALRDLLWSRTPCVLTSATLSTHTGFSYIRSRLRLDGRVLEKQVGSPFDYERQAVLYVPKSMPQPTQGDDREYQRQLLAEVMRVIRLTRGRALVLCTSRKNMQSIARELKARTTHTVLTQGEAPAFELIERFKQGDNAVLVATATFWEGIDVQGDALSCVVMDKLPFAVPTDPVVKARTAEIERRGGNWFADYSVPGAQIKMKQGFGRLIRTSSDKGIVCILDSRLLTKPYGKGFLRALPPAPIETNFPGAEARWHQITSPATLQF